ncbi:MAG: fatty acid desaturase, partial [Saprospiraceae bacterium]|nr:fatty acid desaturase [Saprospiraceae bacterium]
MRQLNTVNDPVFTERPLNAVETFALRFIRDKRDLPFLWLCLQILLTVLPVAVALFFVQGWLWWLLLGLFLILEIYFMGPFILMLHNTSHNPFFKREYKIGNRLIPWGLCPFMGQTPDTYFSHHIGMHHAENNLELDRSSTMAFQRDSMADFLRYFFRFLFFGIFDLFGYLRLRNKHQFLKKAAIGEFVFLAVVIALTWVNWAATFFVFIFPLLIVRFLMMAGNWAQ